MTPPDMRLKKSLDDWICHYDEIAIRAAAPEGVLVEDFYEDDALMPNWRPWRDLSHPAASTFVPKLMC